MTKIDIFSGFLGAGKTTLIKKLIGEAYSGEKLVLIENEFGEIGIDGGFLQEAGIQITEMNSGCICCSLVGDFSKALKKVYEEYSPSRIIIEPSGVGKLSDVIKAVESASLPDSKLNAFCTVVDAQKCKMYMKNFGEFFLDQVQNASCIVLSHTDKVDEEKLSAVVQMLKEKNTSATLVTAPWGELCGKDILAAMEQTDSLQAELERLKEQLHHEHEHHHHEDGEECCCGHHHHDHEHEHHHHEDSEECCCGHHHHDHDHEHHHHHEDGEECCCGHHHHDHEHEHHHHHEDGEECCCGHHHEHEHHHHEDGEECCCGHHHHDHEHEHHHHHADEVFVSWGVETTKTFTKAELEHALAELENQEKYGLILRAKGIVAGESRWLHFDYVPEEPDVREGGAAVIGRLCVIGCQLNEAALKALFNV